MPKAITKPAGPLQEGESLGNKFLDWARDKSAEPKKTKATAARQTAAEKRRAAEKALREAKAAEDQASKGQPKAQQLAVAAEREQKKALVVAQIEERSKFLESLDPFAKEINHRFELATQLDGKADDHRLAAALKIAEARTLCENNGIRFKDWASQNLKEQNYDYVIKLSRVGRADDPALALADLRNKNAERNVKHRAKKKQRERAEPSDGAIYAAASKGNVSDEEIEAASPPVRKPAPQLVGVEALKAAFALLKASDQMRFVQWAAMEVGGVLDFGLDAATEHGSATAQAQFLNQQEAS